VVETNEVIHMGMADADILDLQDLPGRQVVDLPQIEYEGPAPVFHFQIDPGIAPGRIHQGSAEHHHPSRQEEERLAARYAGQGSDGFTLTFSSEEERKRREVVPASIHDLRYKD